MSDSVIVREMRQADLGPANRVFRLAFGTFFQAPDPATFYQDLLWSLMNTKHFLFVH